MVKYYRITGSVFWAFYPLAIGVKDLFSMRRNDDEAREVNPDIKVKFQFLNVALVTFANGGDNIGIYAPLFANIDFRYIYIYLIVFIILTAVWCLIAYYFVKHPRVKALFSKYGKAILNRPRAVHNERIFDLALLRNQRSIIIDHEVFMKKKIDLRKY